MPDARNSIFLSYASQDAEAARRICEALRTARIEVFFDQSELRGGDAWDQKIRTQIRDCELFLPIISRNTQSRAEGYFRLEWRLADNRTHLMGRNRAFLVPVCIDDTRESNADVPDSFSASQWTRLADGWPSPEFVHRIQELLSPANVGRDAANASERVQGIPPALSTPRAVGRRRLWSASIAFLAVMAIGYGTLNRFVLPKRPAEAAFSPPAHSIAVLPFVNMSGDKDQDYFSDGLTEELLNSLARINELQVAARTSAFSFKDRGENAGVVARELNVASILEGSVRRSGHTIRITAKLINATSGFHLWSETYDRDLGDVLKLQTDIANAVASALKITLLENATVKTELGGTRDAAAFDAYLRGAQLARIAMSSSPMDCHGPIDAFSQAITLDARYAIAYAQRAVITWLCASNSAEWLSLKRPDAELVREDANRAIALAPDLADGYVALAELEQGLLHFEAADKACARATVLAPGSSQVLNRCSLLAAYLEQGEVAISGARRAVALDPLDPLSHRTLGDVLRYTRRYDEAINAYEASIRADPSHSSEAYALRGLAFYLAGHLAEARLSCEVSPENYRSRICLALVYHGLGRQGDAAEVLAKLKNFAGSASAYQYAEIDAQWGDHQSALAWFEKALQLRDPGLTYAKVDPLLDPLRQEPRFQVTLRALEFPDKSSIHARVPTS